MLFKKNTGEHKYHTRFKVTSKLQKVMLACSNQDLKHYLLQEHLVSPPEILFNSIHFSNTQFS